MLPRTAALACKTLDPGIMYMSQSFNDVITHDTAQAGRIPLPTTLRPSTVQVHVLKGQRTLRRADPIDWELAGAASCQQRYLCTYTA